MGVLEPWIHSAKSRLRGPYRKTRSRYIRWRYAFGRAELAAAIRRVGVERGDVLFVHSGIAGFEAFRGSVADIVNTFQEAVGGDGALLMPAFSMTGAAVDYAKSGKIFDPRTTPSQMGLIAEVFRRSPGVVRGVHPTHSVAVWGKEPEWWIRDHHLAATPCGRNSPFSRLVERDGKIVFAGAGITHLTLFHFAEELLEPKMPFSPFTQETYTMSFRADGEVRQTAPMRLYRPDVSRRRFLRPIEEALRRAGQWRETKVGTIDLAAARARDIIQTLEDMAGRGVFCYHSDESRRSS